MAYIGSSPAEKGIGLFSQDTFTGDGSTVAFDLSNVIPDGGGNDIQVFVDNVRQQEGASKSYTVGQDGSGDFKRITFNAAPAASASIFVLNPGTKNVLQVTTVGDNVVTTAKVQDSAISTAKIAADAINASKIADDAISEEHLDVTAVTGNTELSATAADDDVLLIFDTSAGTIKKIAKSNVALTVPGFSSVSPTSLTTGDGSGNHTIVVTGSAFDATASFSLRTDGGTTIAMDSVTRNSATQLTGVVAKNTANLTNANEPFDIIILNGNGLTKEALNQINIDASPVFVTSAGSLGTGAGGSSVSFSVNATDPESAAPVTFELQSGSLPAGLSLSNTAAEGGTAVISGTATNPTANTTSNFVLRAVDAASNVTSRAFAITITRTFTSQSFTSSGTFAVPSGVSSLSEVLVVAGGGGGGTWHGGGGGAGGLVYFPGYPVTPGGTVTVTVGTGGGEITPGAGNSKGNTGQDSVFGAPGDPGKHPSGDVLTAKGGGGGGHWGDTTGNPGGSGGGSGANNGCGGPATQPTQPGDSGAYGFGNAGGQGQSAPGGGGGGGGAGAAGNPAKPGNAGDRKRDGGIGKAYTIADGTSPVYYAGGGGGGSHEEDGPQFGVGGQGGGGDGGLQCTAPGPVNQPGHNGTASRGGGGGGSGVSNCGQSSGAGGGGKGIVIVRY